MELIDHLDLQMYTQADTGAHVAHFEDGRKVQFEAQSHPLTSMTKYDYTTFITKVRTKYITELYFDDVHRSCKNQRAWLR